MLQKINITGVHLETKTMTLSVIFRDIRASSF